MSHDNDNWVNLAISDDSKVVDILLLLLHHHQPPPPPPHLDLHWTVRQRRSRSIPKNNKADPTASPTTPLSWSGGAVDGDEDTSHITKHVHASSRSKVANPNGTSTAKKLRRKKTLAELKEEENLLLQERRSLTNELASLRATVEKHRATNESLKRMKLDLESRQNYETATTTFDVSGKAVLDLPHFMEAQFIPSSSLSPKIVTPKVPDNDSLVCAANTSSKPQENGNQEIPFALPDLNLPVDDDFSTSAMH